MFASKLRSIDKNDYPQDSIENNLEYKITDYGYGKDSVKILHVKRNDLVHSVKEFEVSTRLQLYSKKDYIYGMFLLYLLFFVFLFFL